MVERARVRRRRVALATAIVCAGPANAVAQDSRPASVDELRAQLRSERTEVKHQALETLAELGARAAPAAADLAALLPQRSVSFAAADALRRIGGTAAIAQLVEAVGRADLPEWARSNVLIALRRIGPPAVAAVPSVAALVSGDGQVARRAEDALAALGMPGVAELLRLRARHAGDRERCSRLLWALGRGADVNPIAEAALVRIRFEGSQEAQQEVENVLTSIGQHAGAPEAVAAWLEHARAPDPVRRTTALVRLERLGLRAAPALPFLLERLQDGAETERITVARAIAGTGAAGRAALAPLLRAERDATREWAVIALGYAGEPAIDALIAVLGDASERVRWRATNALQRVGPPAAAPLRAALGGGDATAAAAARAALERIER